MLRIALLAALAGCINQPPVAVPSTDNCSVPQAGAPPTLHPQACGDQVCLPPADAVALSKWIVRVKAENQSLTGCPFVVWFDPETK